ncbi:defender against death DAD protein [Aspergillus campestris IBT 28561]|uniref:Dolichyl-diphosphooligosaccharide--protein glycosyltransferase subunit OST2 n=1 Tax=Aspergillus campestris (strain IBT 28561) TaxID=1392248 RepID=A0A2I1D370_ASPC2|nr:defender against death DAD protein [Aspergillus campestris IBT 28561]PKY04308.1 defender against death DAD protein [Aspergillus campestris IBT 28561]
MPSKRSTAAASPAASSSPSTTTATTTTAAASTPKLSSGPKTLSTNSSAFEIAQHVWQQYLTSTPQRTKMLDAFMGFLALIGAVQFLYCVLAGNYPFNAFLSGFSASVGQFVLTASLRMQTTNGGSGSGSGSASSGKAAGKGKSGGKFMNESGEEGISHERAFADFVFGSLILHFFCINFIN